MSEVIGIIGQGYENRKTKKAGILVSRDEVKKTLHLINRETDERFDVSEASFRSNWRKIRNDTFVGAEPGVCQKEEEVSVGVVSNEDVIQDFIDSLRVRNFHFTHNPKMSDVTTLFIDGVEAFSMEKQGGRVKIATLPDLYTYTDIKDHVVPGTLKFATGKKLSVTFVSDYSAFGEVLQAIKEMAKEINLYGYIVE